jgi:Domain of unknown function (DUF1931)
VTRSVDGDCDEQKTYDLLIRGKAAATANGRDIIEPSDLPITKGLQESIHEFRKIDADIDLKSILEYIAALPPLNLTYSYETEEQLPGLVGGLSVALARAFTIIDPDLKNPQTKHWERALRIFDLLL